MEFYRPQSDKEKRRQKRKTRFWAGTVAVVIFILFFSAVYAIGFSDIFKIKNIFVSGLSGVPGEKLAADLKEFIGNNSKISEILGSENILAWIFGTDGFLEKEPQLAQLSVKNDFFKREITIEAQEREKFGLWCVKEEICFWFDKEGVVFAEAPMVETELLRRVEDFSGRGLKIGDAILDKEFILNLEAVFSVLEQADLKTKTVSLSDIGLEEITIDSTYRSPKIFFSLKFSPEPALAVITELKKTGKWAGLQYIDFRSENRAYFK